MLSFIVLPLPVSNNDPFAQSPPPGFSQLEVVRRKIQIQSMAMAAARGSMRHHPHVVAGSIVAVGGLQRIGLTIKEIVKAEGPGGFYAGMGPNLVQVLPSSALSYYTYSTLKQILHADNS